MRAFLRVSIAATVFVAACEDGPTQLFKPNEGDPKQQNGFAPAEPWVAGGGNPTKGYDNVSGGDSVGRARFCDEEEASAQVRTMVGAPIIPDVSIGTVPLLAPDGKLLYADDLLGRPEDGKFCDPTVEYANAFTYGPLDEVIVFFNQETRLVEGVMAYTQYLGSMTGTFTEGGREIPIVVKPRERLTIDGVELDQYTSSADQASKPNAWLNHQNASRLYKMIRETFFNAPPFPDDYNCVTEKTCDIIYTASSEATPQDAFIVVRDSGFQIRFQPDGHLIFVYLEPIRSAPFEAEGEIVFGAAMATEMSFGFQSTSRSACSINLDEQMTFGTFKSRCIDQGDDRTLARVTYAVESARDAVNLSFNGIDLSFLRSVREKPVLRDGEEPADDDVLYSIGFFRTLNAPVEEFKPRTLANLYKTRLEQRLRDAIIADGPIPREMHPLALYSVSVPPLTDAPQIIGEITTTLGAVPWIPQVLSDVLALYVSLPPEEQAMVDPQIIEPVFLIEPFVDGVLEAFSHGESELPGTFKAFRTTDDRRWSIGQASFVRNNVPYRVQAQYSLNYGAITAVYVERGDSDIDELLANANTRLQASEPYYTADLMRRNGNPYGIGGTAIRVMGFDRQLDTLNIEADNLLANGTTEAVTLTVPGLPIEDRNGYLRQIRGERWEFVPANVVQFYGKESSYVFYVEADGAIGRVDANSFKGEAELCAGLPIRYGDDVQQIVTAWADSVPLDTYRDCDIVFNYSINGNVLDSISSLSNRTMITVVAGRATAATVWR